MQNVKLPAWVQQLNAVKKGDGLSEEDKKKLELAKNYAKEVGPDLVSRKAQIKAEIEELAATQTTSKWLDMLPVFCRIYVGGVNYDVMEVHLRAVFGQFGYLTSVALSYEAMESRHKGFSFIEFDTPEAATNAISEMDGALLGGRNIKVGRPQQYPAEGNTVLPKAPKSRIYVSNILDIVSENDVKEMFEAYGQIKAMSMPVDSKKHKGYAFIEYENAAAANGAIQAMNGFELGGQKLKVSRAILGIPLVKGPSLSKTHNKNLPANIVSIANAINSSVQESEKK